jgi:predicted nucleotidyltransferase
MDLTRPLRTIAPGLDAGVLTALAGTESALSASAIARLAGYGTRNGQAPVLDRLVQHGLVLAEPGNLGHLYRLNREHVLAPAVLAAVAARSELLARLREALDALGPALTHASLFGSFARGEARPDSDIDLLVVTADEQPHHWHDMLVDLGDQVRAWTGNHLETVALTQSHLARVAPQEAVVAAWLADGVTLHGPDLADLLSSLAAAS